MGRFYRRGIGSFVVWLLLSGHLAGALGAGPTTPQKISRWESNLSIGWVNSGRIGIVKSFWWFAVPRVIALGLSFDYITQSMPLSVNVALNAPIPVIRPFVCAGAGIGLTGGSLTHYGGGLKVRLIRKFGVIVEYRRYYYFVDATFYTRKKANAHYFGAGISWVY
jgi:hypothetical protein